MKSAVCAGVWSKRAALGVVLACGAASATFGADVVLSFDQPSLDRWVYPFDSAPGFRDSSAVFGSLGQEDSFPPFSFDQRDAQILLGYDLRGGFPIGLGVCRYRVVSAVVTMTTSTDLAFRYDPTYDGFATYPSADTDQGRPVELYGAAFRAGWQACPIDGAPANNAFPCYFEGTQTVPAPPFGPSIQKDVRYAFPTDFPGGAERDISNNVRDRFDPAPFAVGQIAGLAAGAQVPIDRDMTFTLDVADADVQAFLRRAANTGQLRLVVTSLQSASSGGGGGPGTGSYASFYHKEFIIPGFAARLTMTLRTLPEGDADGSGSVGFPDVTTVLANYGEIGPAGIDGDADCSGEVGFTDITAVLRNWGASTL